MEIETELTITFEEHFLNNCYYQIKSIEDLETGIDKLVKAVVYKTSFSHLILILSKKVFLIVSVKLITIQGGH